MSRANKRVHPYEVEKHYYGGGMDNEVVDGITLREHFAAMAMQGIQAQYTCQDGYDPANVARHAVIQADELLAALEKP